MWIIMQRSFKFYERGYINQKVDNHLVDIQLYCLWKSHIQCNSKSARVAHLQYPNFYLSRLRFMHCTVLSRRLGFHTYAIWYCIGLSYYCLHHESSLLLRIGYLQGLSSCFHVHKSLKYKGQWTENSEQNRHWITSIITDIELH